MNALLLLAFVATQPGESTAAVKFDALTFEQAARLDGRAVSIAFTVDTPAYTIGEGERLITVVGPADRGDGAEWSVVLRGDRLNDTDVGAKLKVSGTLAVIRHPAAVVGGVLVPAWVEVRVTEG